jgi:hypothetical protein
MIPPLSGAISREPVPAINADTKASITGSLNLGDNKYEFASFFDATIAHDEPEPVTLYYKITVTEFTINKSDDNKGKITVDMVIVLPLEFSVSTPSRYYADYVKLSLGDALPNTVGTGDLFGRNGKDDDLLNTIGYVTITLKDIVNTVMPRITLAIRTRSDTPAPLTLLTGNSALLTITDFSYPFSPEFEILFPRDGNDQPGTFKIGRIDLMELDFFLSVEAQAEINQTIDL